jgi:hypothetical protein
MSAEVKYIGSDQFTLSMNDTTTKPKHAWTFSTTQTLSGTLRNSAEWIAESPFGLIGELPLAPFGTVYFTHDTAVTTLHTVPTPIGSFPAVQVGVITAVCYPRASPAKSATSALDKKTGANFNIVWLRLGPEG